MSGGDTMTSGSSGTIIKPTSVKDGLSAKPKT